VDNYYLFEKIVDSMYSIKARTFIEKIECEACRFYNTEQQFCGAIEAYECPPVMRNLTALESHLWSIRDKI
jgi:hypothetical protein